MFYSEARPRAEFDPASGFVNLYFFRATLGLQCSVEQARELAHQLLSQAAFAENSLRLAEQRREHARAIEKANDEKIEKAKGNPP